MQKPNANRKRENLLLNLAFNLIFPIILLRKGDEWFGALLAEWLTVKEDDPQVAGIILVAALSFPLGYGIRDFVVRQRFNVVSVLGFVSVLCTGGIGLLELSTQIFAIKEAALPAIIGLTLIIFRDHKNSLTRTFLYNPDILQVDLVESALNERGNSEKFAELLTRCSYYLAASFFLSSVLNYILARAIVTTEPAINKALYNEEVGEMMGWSFPVIALPCMLITIFVLWRLFAGIRELAGINPEEMIASKPAKE